MSTRHEEAVLTELEELRRIAKNFLKKCFKMLGYEAEVHINKTLLAYSLARETTTRGK